MGGRTFKNSDASDQTEVNDMYCILNYFVANNHSLAPKADRIVPPSCSVCPSSLQGGARLQAKIHIRESLD